MISFEKINLNLNNIDLNTLLTNMNFEVLFEKNFNGEKYAVIVLEKAFELMKKEKKYYFKANSKIIELKNKKNYLNILYEYRKKAPNIQNKLLPLGGIGYIGYEFFDEIENFNFKKKYIDNFYDCHFIFGRSFLILNYIKNDLSIYSVKYSNEIASINTKSNVNKIKTKLLEIFSKKYTHKNTTNNLFYKIIKNETKENFCNKVSKIKQEITEGNLIQCVLSRSLKIKTNIPYLNLYKKLRINNPSPYMFYMNFENITLFGTSPELMVQINDKRLTVNPIAGTKQRGKNKTEDIKLTTELLNDNKEKAEHLMLVDLARNDLGKVSKKNTVKVKNYMQIKKYENVMHIVSKVQGTLDKNKTTIDVIKATFPAGTVTGAPKIQAIKTIEHLETERRGPYAGLVGYFDSNGNFDSCITIRTAICTKNTIRLQAGAGIVYDSIPEKEYIETENKLKSLLQIFLNFN